jgi:DNA-binding MarR family transcriptional regulator
MADEERDRSPIDFNGLDSAVHGPIRLGALTSLHTDGPLDFTTLRKRLDVAHGALGMHLRKLEEAGYVNCQKTFVGRRPRSIYRITPRGRSALAGYLAAMQELIRAVERGTVGEDESNPAEG